VKNLKDSYLSNSHIDEVTYLTLIDSTNRWVEEQLEDVSLDNIKKEKVIRDALFDANMFSIFEINVMDLPIVQRLRRISQTGFAHLTYPSSTHNRFEHTLGVTTIASKFADAIRKKDQSMMDEQTIRELRLAGLLHDIGHGPFSHISELVFGQLPDVEKELKSNPKFSKVSSKPHEMLSHMITTSKCLKDFYEDELSFETEPIDLNNVANIIVGDMENSDNAYISDIINGAFDADKLDYIPRDCYFTGLKMEVDIDRIMYTVSIDTNKTFERQGLMIDIGGAPFIEQILFNKMMLFTSLYHHHKVRTLECMFLSIFEACKDHKLEMNGFSFEKATDFLSVTDMEILTLEGKPDEIKPLIENIRNRNLLKRALVISQSTIEKPKRLSTEKAGNNIKMKYQDLIELSEDPVRIRQLRDLIVEEIGRKLTPYDVWIDLPSPPSFREPSNTVIKITEDDRRTLDKIFPISNWLTTYAENKWKGHVFCPPEYRDEVNKASIKIFKDELGIEFNESATTLAKI